MHISEASSVTVPSLLDATVEIERVVSRGTLATVYKGRRAGGPVALKVYRADLASAADWRERIAREEAAQSQVTHPCVARHLHTGQAADGSIFIVTEWVEGATLAERLAAAPMTWPAFAPILASVARGLAAIHGKDVIHRDIKPSNIVLPETGTPRAKIIDFGHALPLLSTRLTDQGWTLGSAAYMAPEQAAGELVDERTDLYALGVVLYRALTGVLPFRGSSAAEVMLSHQHDPVRRPCALAPEIPKSAEDLCLWLLAKDRAHRVPTARVLLVTLQSITIAHAPELQ